jgi:transposase-like protein
MRKSLRKILNPTAARVPKRLRYPLDVILTCVRWYVAYPLSLRHLEEMMFERGIEVDHSTVHRWAMKLLPVLEKVFRRHKRMVGKSWRMDETYIKVKGNGSICIAPWTRTATQLISCFAPGATRSQRGVISKNR